LCNSKTFYIGKLKFEHGKQNGTNKNTDKDNTLCPIVRGHKNKMTLLTYIKGRIDISANWYSIT
jgi:hypothetical protein